MTAPHRLAFALKQRTLAAAIDEAETPRAQLDKQVDYLRALLKLAEPLDPEAAATITKGVVEGVRTGTTEVRELIERAIGTQQGPGAGQGPSPGD
jgi:hypothetical protein